MLMHFPKLLAPEEEDGELEVQVAKIVSSRIPENIVDLLNKQPTDDTTDSNSFSSQQLADPELILYLRDGVLPENGQQAQEVITLAQRFTMSDNILYCLNSKQGELPQILFLPH